MSEKWNKRRRQMTFRESDDRIVPQTPDDQSGGTKSSNIDEGKAVSPAGAPGQEVTRSRPDIVRTQWRNNGAGPTESQRSLCSSRMPATRRRISRHVRFPRLHSLLRIEPSETVQAETVDSGKEVNRGRVPCFSRISTRSALCYHSFGSLLKQPSVIRD